MSYLSLIASTPENQYFSQFYYKSYALRRFKPRTRVTESLDEKVLFYVRS
jgi:hypothetical protein